MGYSIGRDVIVDYVPPDRIGEGSPTPARQWDQKENMKKYEVVLSYDVQKTFVVEAENYEEAEAKAIAWKGDTGKDNWEYRDLIENEEIK